MLSQPELNAVLDQLVKGDSDVFWKIITEYRLPLRSYLASQIHHSQDVDDLAQEVFRAVSISPADPREEPEQPRAVPGVQLPERAVPPLRRPQSGADLVVAPPRHLRQGPRLCRHLHCL